MLSVVGAGRLCSLSSCVCDLLKLGLNGMVGEHWHVGYELALDQVEGDALVSVEVLDGDSSFEFASDLLVRLAGGIATDIVFAAGPAEVIKTMIFRLSRSAISYNLLIAS